MVQYVFGLIGRVLWIERHEHRPHLRDGKYRKEELAAVRQDEGYFVAFCDAEAIETLRDAIYFPLELSVSPAPFCKGKSDFGRVARYSLIQKFAQSCR